MKQPNIEPVSENYYRLMETYYYKDSNVTIKIPGADNGSKGYTYDGASVPRWAWSIIGLTPDGLIRAAALVHDWIGDFSGTLPVWSQIKPTFKTYTRKENDDMFYRNMIKCGVDKRKARIAWMAVRVAGGLFWNKPPRWTDGLTTIDVKG